MADEKKKVIDRNFKVAEGGLDSVGSQGGNAYLIVGGKKIYCNDDEIMKVEVRKK